METVTRRRRSAALAAASLGLTLWLAIGAGHGAAQQGSAAAARTLEGTVGSSPVVAQRSFPVVREGARVVLYAAGARGAAPGVGRQAGNVAGEQLEHGDDDRELRRRQRPD